MALYSFAMSRGSGLYFFYFNPLAPWALPLYSLTETQGERRVNSITSIAGLFNPSPSDLPYILRYKTQGEEGSTGFENEVGYRSFFFAVL